MFCSLSMGLDISSRIPVQLWDGPENSTIQNLFIDQNSSMPMSDILNTS